MITYEGAEDPEDRLRRLWAESLTEHLACSGVSRKGLQLALAEVGVDVSVRAVGQWLTGETTPRPHVQAAIAHVLRVPPRSLWPLHFGPAA